MKQPCILLVEPDNDMRRRMSAWLEDEGYEDVLICPGPSEPEYTCLGGKGSACPLADAADIVVVDLRLRSDVMLMGTPGWQLMLYYYEKGKKIVAISGPQDPLNLRPDEQVTVIGRPVERAPFLQAVRSFTFAYVS